MIDLSKELNVFKTETFESYFINTNLDVSIEDRVEMIRDCVQQHNRRIDKVEPPKYFPTIKIDQYNIFPIYDKLFSTFVTLAEKHLQFEIQPWSGRNIWLYYNNKDFECNYGIHNHINKTIVCVYYLNVPETQNDNDGTIIFYDPEEIKIFDFKPKTNDMIIFPGYLKHSVLPYVGEEPRLSLVMELEC